MKKKINSLSHPNLSLFHEIEKLKWKSTEESTKTKSCSSPLLLSNENLLVSKFYEIYNSNTSMKNLIFYLPSGFPHIFL